MEQTKMRIFLSWSGPRSRAFAEALAEWLPNVLQGTNPFFSPNMERGINWINKVLEELATTSFGVICVTPSNADARWINFEAGALAKGIPGGVAHVVPIAIGFKSPADIGLPLSAFNAMGSGRDDFLGLVKTINDDEANPAPLGEKQLDSVFDKWWPDLESAIKVVSEAHPEETKTVSDEAKLDQILTAVLDLARQNATASDIEALVAKYSGFPVSTALSDMLAPSNLHRLAGDPDVTELRLRIAQKSLDLTLRDMGLSHLRPKFHLTWIEPDATHVVVPTEIFEDGQTFSAFQTVFGDRVGGNVTFRGAGNAVENMLSDLAVVKETLVRTLTLFGLPDVAMRPSHTNSEEIEIIEPHSLHASVPLKVSDNLFVVFPTVKKITFVRSDGTHVVDVERPELSEQE